MKPVRILFLFLVFLFSCQTPENKQEEYANISGIYPHLAMFNHSLECGQGAIVPWAGRLWVVTYAPHAPFGSDDKLYEIDERLQMTARKESIGGTPANRMIHRASKQLIIGPYFIDEKRNVRVVPWQKMPGRLTATAAHLTDPENEVYMVTMEEGLYSVNVHSLDVKVIYPDGNENKGSIDQPWLPGTHGKGAYTSQGYLVYANNGEWEARSNPSYSKPSGCLAEWNGKDWKVVERKQFTEVTGPGGIYGNAQPSDPVWSLGWDQCSVILKLLDHEHWYTYRLPKASFTYGAKNGWFTEWPRIRQIDEGRLLMTMFGMFWQFPKSFSADNTADIMPLSSYLKIIGDFAFWHDRIVFACDDASLMGNKYVGQAQSNLWFVKPEALGNFGPSYGFGGVWVSDTVKAGIPSDPWLVNGFDKLMIHLANGSDQSVTFTLETDKEGKNKWEEYNNISVPAHGYQYYIFPADLSAQWIRLRSNQDIGPVTAYFFAGQTDRRKTDPEPDIFTSLPKEKAAGEYTFGLIRPRGHDLGTLQFAARKTDKNGNISVVGYYEVDQDMNIKKIDDDSLFTWMEKNFPVSDIDFEQDDASVIVKDRNGNRYRLPFGDSAFLKDKNRLPGRGLREVVTERSLLNAMGTFYEVPRPSAGGYARIKPVCTHNRRIYDFCSWRGMMVISGNLINAKENGHYFRSTDKQTGLWFGTIDDLWQLGKPHGIGGPWNHTHVQAGIPSDPYLMTGYDGKTLTLSADRDVEITAEISVGPDLQNWHIYRKFFLKKNTKTRYNFPSGYEAHWIRFIAGLDCHVTAILTYK